MAKIHLDIFLSKYICRQFLIVYFQAFYRFSRHLEKVISRTDIFNNPVGEKFLSVPISSPEKSKKNI